MSKPEQNGSVESLDQLKIPATSGDDDDDNNSDEELPPPLPSRLPNLEDTMKRTEPSENVFQFDKVQQPVEKPKKGVGLKIFKKKHRRQMSDGNVVVDKIKNGSDKGGLSPSPKFHHRRSKSQADVLNVVQNSEGMLGHYDASEMYAEVHIPSNKTRGSSDEKPPIKPYLEVDITEPPHTPTDMKPSKSVGGETEDQSGSYELPEGWREVKGESGTYYWHVASGTTQWTLPQVATRPKVKKYFVFNPWEGLKIISFPYQEVRFPDLCLIKHLDVPYMYFVLCVQFTHSSSQDLSFLQFKIMAALPE